MADIFGRYRKNQMDLKISGIRILPIQPTSGNGNQVVYLASISQELSGTLLGIIQDGNSATINELLMAQNEIDEEIEQHSIAQSTIPQISKEQLILARVGQGLFKKKVSKIESGCRLTGIVDSRFLIASHIKPWKVSTNEERLDGNNGLLLSPHADKLFDAGWISFNDDGSILLTDESIKDIIKNWGLEHSKNVGPFNAKQKEYLHFHRIEVLRSSLVEPQTP